MTKPEMETSFELDGFQDKHRPKCVWCNAPWTDDMIRVEDVYASEGCDTCGYGSEVFGTIRINCSSCGRLVYQKDFNKIR